MSSKFIDVKIVRDLEDILYGEVPKTALYSDDDEFEEAKLIFQKAEIGREFAGTVHYQEWLLPQALEEQKQANDAFHSYQGANTERIAVLRQRLLNADFLVNWLKGLVEDAKTFPRPIKIN